MKKLLLLAAFLASSASLFAQGQVAFANTASTAFRMWTNNPSGTASNLTSGANAYRFGLYAAQGAGQPAGSLQLVGLATNIALPGYFSGGNPFAMPAPFASGDIITFQIKGWTLAGGLDYASAVTAQNSNPTGIGLGQSGLGQTVLTANPAPPASLFGTAPGQISNGFGIVPAPEPSSIALGLLGLGAIALFRRRK